MHIPHAHSLKDKRMVARSLTDKVRRRFNVSVAEVDTQDIHQTLTLGIAIVSGDAFWVHNMLEEIIHYIELNADAELVTVERNL